MVESQGKDMACVAAELIISLQVGRYTLYTATPAESIHPPTETTSTTKCIIYPRQWQILHRCNYLEVGCQYVSSNHPDNNNNTLAEQSLFIQNFKSTMQL